MQLSNVSVKLSSTGWHRRLQVYTFGPKVPLFANLCPHFWLTIACLFISPFKFTPLLLWAGVVKAALGVAFGAKYLIAHPFMFAWEKAGQAANAFGKAAGWVANNTLFRFFGAVDDALPGIKKVLFATGSGIATVSNWVAHHFVGVPIMFSFLVMFWCLDKWGRAMEWFFVKALWGTCVAVYRSPYSPLRPIRWFLRGRYTRMVIDGNEKMLLSSLEFMERWMEKLIPLDGYQGAGIYDLTDEDWLKLETSFYEALATKYQGRRRYSYQYYQAIKHWQYLQACRNLSTDWEDAHSRTMNWRENVIANREAAAAAWRQRFVTIVNTTQMIGRGAFVVGKVCGVVLLTGAILGVVSAACYYGYQVVCWLGSTGFPNLWGAITSFWTASGIFFSEVWLNAGVYVQGVVFVLGTLFLLYKAVATLHRLGLWKWGFHNVVAPVFKGLHLAMGTVGGVIERPIVWVGKRTVAPAAKQAWGGLSFFVLYLKAAKENQCPHIEWGDEGESN